MFQLTFRFTDSKLKRTVHWTLLFALFFFQNNFSDTDFTPSSRINRFKVILGPRNGPIKLLTQFWKVLIMVLSLLKLLTLWIVSIVYCIRSNKIKEKQRFMYRFGPSEDRFYLFCSVFVNFYARSQNCEKWLLASSCLPVRLSDCPSVRQRGTTPLLLGGFSWSFVFILRGDDSDRTYLRRCSIRAWIRLRCLEEARERRRQNGVTSSHFKW